MKGLVLISTVIISQSLWAAPGRVTPELVRDQRSKIIVEMKSDAKKVNENITRINSVVESLRLEALSEREASLRAIMSGADKTKSEAVAELIKTLESVQKYKKDSPDIEKVVTDQQLNSLVDLVSQLGNMKSSSQQSVETVAFVTQAARLPEMSESNRQLWVQAIEGTLTAIKTLQLPNGKSLGSNASLEEAFNAWVVAQYKDRAPEVLKRIKENCK
jgi:alanyl-tRNA synthetase